MGTKRKNLELTKTLGWALGAYNHLKGTKMKLLSMRSGIGIQTAILAAGLAFVPVLFAQQGSGTGQQTQQDQQAKPTPPALPSAAEATKPTPEAPKVNPEEEAAYKTFFETKPGEADKQIELGQQFLQKYPASRYAEAVNGRLAKAYYGKQDWNDFYASADKALALNPDDVDLLVLVGWVIPHSYNPNDLDADRRLDKAENYEKHALELIPGLPKPVGLTDEQFAAAKAGATSQAHSGLGLVYFRRQDFANSVAELQKGTSGTASPDPTDYFVMGIELLQLKRFGDAADAFQKCSQIPSGLQDRCKKAADQAKTQATAPATPPKQ
jgi:tetratricopeptide (TPR) repeat protein